MQVPQRSEALGSLEVTGSCEPHYIGTGNQLRSSAREVYAFNLISPARIKKYSSDIKRQQKCVHLSDQRSLPEKLKESSKEAQVPGRGAREGHQTDIKYDSKLPETVTEDRSL